MHSVCSGAAGAAYHMYLIWHVEGEATGEVMLSALRSSALHHVLECC